MTLLARQVLTGASSSRISRAWWTRARSRARVRHRRASIGVTEDGKRQRIVVGCHRGPDPPLRARCELVRLGSEALGGKGGGGRPDMAQAGGPDGTKATEALDAVKAALAG